MIFHKNHCKIAMQSALNIIPTKYHDTYIYIVLIHGISMFTKNSNSSIMTAYKLKTDLPSSFIEISLNSMFNYQYICHLELIDSRTKGNWILCQSFS